jgi:ABC-type antimicrobial peptide transport system permease subunit
MGMELIAGREFSNDPYKDTASVILNESAVRVIGLKEPFNQVISWNSGTSTIIGVVKDAILESPYKPVEPTVFACRNNDNDAQFMMYRLSANVKMQDAYPLFGKIFAKHNPAFQYSYQFVSDKYNQKFKLESLIGKLAAIFSVLAIFISCLGLYALAAYTAEQRSKEIGIRKVLGASVTQLWMLLCKDFVVLVVISCIIASPIAVYFLNNWLMGFDYRINLGPAVFIVAAAVALLITITTISFQAIKAAIANPVKSLKTQ